MLENRRPTGYDSYKSRACSPLPSVSRDRHTPVARWLSCATHVPRTRVLHDCYVSNLELRRDYAVVCVWDGMVNGEDGSAMVVNGAMSPPAPGPQDHKKNKTDNRRSNKPIMEKRRRARINNCLNELKSLILDAMKKDPARHSKLEKADILEMTVKYLEGLRSEGATSPDKFRAGYRHCLSEVAKYQGLDAGIRRRLVTYLESTLSSSGQRPAAAPTPPSDNEDQPIIGSHSTIFISAGSGAGVRLVKTRLSNGDIALVLPAGVSANMLGALPTLVPLSPRDVASSSASSEQRCFSPESSGWGSPPPTEPPEEPMPLALVMRKPPEEKPWRPW